MNALSAQLISSMLVSMRSDTWINANLCELVTDCVPCPTLSILSAKLSPLIPRSAVAPKIRTYDVAVNLVNLPATLDFDLSTKKYLALSWSHIGNITRKDLCPICSKLSTMREYNFVDWSSQCRKLGAVSTPPVYLPESTMYPSPEQCCMLANSLAAEDFLLKCEKSMVKEMDCPNAVKRFEDAGVEKETLLEALEGVRSVGKDYEEVGLPLPEEEADAQ